MASVPEPGQQVLGRLPRSKRANGPSFGERRARPGAAAAAELTTTLNPEANTFDLDLK
jgi:hypothetical protein